MNTEPQIANWREIGKSLSNWGRWGNDDQRGTTNLITEDHVRMAAGLVKRGAVFDLGLAFDENGPQIGNGRTNPIRLMSALRKADASRSETSVLRFNDDYIIMPLQAATQWDALAHVYYDELMYNETPADFVSSEGAKRLGIETQAPGIVGRGVLLDVAAHCGVEWLASGEVIQPALLDEVAEAQNVQVSEGDILLVRTGWRRMYLTNKDRKEFLATEPGLGIECCSWLKERGVAAVASDNWALEAIPGQLTGEGMVVHMILIRDMGMTLGEMFDFETLSADCANDGVYEFFFSSPVLKFTGGVGSPISPVAIK
jgi:kynurenine formamidase